MGKKNTGHLVQVEKWITRNGTTFKTKVLINPNKVNTVSKIKTTIPLEDWAKINTMEDFEKCRKAIFANGDEATKQINKREFVDFMERSGVHWNRCNTNANVDYMRCMMKAKKMISNGEFVADGSGKAKKINPYKRMSTPSARKLVQEFTKDLISTSSTRENAEYMIKTIITQEGITWNHSDNPNIDRMRMLMALREHIEDGKSFGALDHKRERNPEHIQYLKNLQKKSSLDKFGFVEYDGGMYNSSATSFHMPNYSTDKSTELWTVRTYNGDIPLPSNVVRPERKEVDYKAGMTSEEFDKIHEENKKQFDKEWKQYSDTLRELVEANYKRPLLFKSGKDVQKWADELGIIIDPRCTDEKLVDIHAWNDIAPVVEEMLELYPQLKSRVVDGKPTPFQIMYADWKSDNTFLMANAKGLLICPCYRDYKKTMCDLFDCQARGWNVRSEGTPKAIIRHEFGHMVEKIIMHETAFAYDENGLNFKHSSKVYYDKETKKKEAPRYSIYNIDYKRYTKYKADLKRKRTNVMKRKTKDGHSEYSVYVPSGVELISEGFSAFTGGETTKFAKEIYEFMKKFGAIASKGKDPSKEEGNKK